MEESYFMAEVRRTCNDIREMDRFEASIDRLAARGIARHDFMRYCADVACLLGLEDPFIPRIAHTLTTGTRPTVVWLQFANCTGCMKAFLRTTDPFLDELILNRLSLVYQDSSMVPYGEKAEVSLKEVLDRDTSRFLCIVEGAIPTAFNGCYGMIGGKTMLEVCRDVCPKAKRVITLGNCASFGSQPATRGGLTGAKGVRDAIGLRTINLPGCPPDSVNLAALLTSYLMLNKFPPLDMLSRPIFARKQPRLSRQEPGWHLQDFAYRKPGDSNCPTNRFTPGSSVPLQTDASLLSNPQPR